MKFARLFLLAVVCSVISNAAWSGGLPESHFGARFNCTSTHERPAASSVGPFIVTNPDSTSRLRLRFFGQMLLEYDSLDRGGDESRSSTLVMQARRIRPILEFKLAEPRLFFRLHMSMAPGSIEMMDVFFDLALHGDLQLRYGQYKVPFTQYRMESFQSLTLVDWSIVTKGFGAERQMGFALHNGYEDPPRYGYVFGVLTGVNARASHAIYLPKLVYDKDLPNPSDLADPAPFAEFHPELFLHVSRNTGGIEVNSPSDEERTGLRYSAAFSAAWDLNPSPYYDFRVRLAPELLVKHRGLSVKTVGYAGYVEMGSSEKTRLGMLGSLIELAYRFNDRYEIPCRYALVDFRDALLEDALLEGSANLVRREEEVRIGLNRYFDGHSLKWQNDLGWLTHRRENRDTTDIVLRSQFQLVF